MVVFLSFVLEIAHDFITDAAATATNTTTTTPLLL